MGEEEQQLRVIPEFAGGGAGNWPRTEMAHTVLAEPGETVLSAGSGVLANEIFPTTMITEWSGHFETPPSGLAMGESFFGQAGIDVLTIPRSLWESFVGG
jgi:hypothetical protein